MILCFHKAEISCINMTHRLENAVAGSPATVRMAELLHKLSPAAAADVLASMLTRDTAFKQLVLEAVEPNGLLSPSDYVSLRKVKPICQQLHNLKAS